MRILVIGGTSFVGRAITARALDQGHDVTLFNRGRTGAELFPSATRLTGDRDSDLSALADDEVSWDATIDVCGYSARQVRTLLTALGERAGHYTFVSTISVHPEDVPDGYTEDAELLPANWADQPDRSAYGQQKVACEQVARELAGDRLLVVRPGFVVGAHDPTGRFTYWVERVRRGGGIVGADAHQPLQVVDARDLAAFVVGAVERRVVDTVTVAAPAEAPTFDEVLHTIGDTLDTTAYELHWHGRRDELPLTLSPTDWTIMRADTSRARGHGLWSRPLADTVRDIVHWVDEVHAGGGRTGSERFGLDSETERGLVTADS